MLQLLYRHIERCPWYYIFFHKSYYNSRQMTKIFLSQICSKLLLNGFRVKINRFWHFNEYELGFMRALNGSEVEKWTKWVIFFPLPDILQMTFGLFKGVKYNVLTQYKNRAIDLICVYKDKAERNLEFYISHESPR